MLEDNGYAISVPVEVNTPGGNISRLVANFPNFHFEEVDGTDAEASLRAFQTCGRALPRRTGPGICPWPLRPASTPIRSPTTTSSIAPPPSAKPTPCAIRSPSMQMRLLREGILTAEQINALEKKLEHEAAEAADRALDAPLPAVCEHPAARLLRGPGSDAAHPSLPRQAQAAGSHPGKSASAQGQRAAHHGRPHQRLPPRRDARATRASSSMAKMSPTPAAKKRSSEVKGKGGVFKLTAGLQTEFGSERVFNSPLAEANIVGRAVGYAVRGMKPVVEIQFFDYIWPASAPDPQ